MTTTARDQTRSLVAQPTAPCASDDGSRTAQYEAILGQIATGVFILETADVDDPGSLAVVVVNEMGRRFFGRGADTSCRVLEEAGH